MSLTVTSDLVVAGSEAARPVAMTLASSGARSQVRLGTLAWSTPTSGPDADRIVVSNSGRLEGVSGAGLIFGPQGTGAPPRLAAHGLTRGYTPGSSTVIQHGGRCYTCPASDITETAPPSESLDAGSGIDALTGDFTTSQSIFKCPGLRG